MQFLSAKEFKAALLFLLLLVMGSMVITLSAWGYQPVISPGEISIAIPIGTYEIRTSATGDEIYINDFGRLMVPGKPNLPSNIFSLAIPPGAEVTQVRFETGEGVLLPGTYHIAPSILPRVIGQENPLLYEQDQKMYEEHFKSIYQSDDPYPSSVGEMVQASGYRKYNLVDVRQPQEYERGHLPGAKLIPVGELENRLKELDPTKPTIAY